MMDMAIAICGDAMSGKDALYRVSKNTALLNVPKQLQKLINEGKEQTPSL